MNRASRPKVLISSSQSLFALSTIMFCWFTPSSSLFVSAQLMSFVHLQVWLEVDNGLENQTTQHADNKQQATKKSIQCDCAWDLMMIMFYIPFFLISPAFVKLAEKALSSWKLSFNTFSLVFWWANVISGLACESTVLTPITSFSCVRVDALRSMMIYQNEIDEPWALGALSGLTCAHTSSISPNKPPVNDQKNSQLHLSHMSLSNSQRYVRLLCV